MSEPILFDLEIVSGQCSAHFSFRLISLLAQACYSCTLAPQTLCVYVASTGASPGMSWKDGVLFAISNSSSDMSAAISAYSGVDK